MGFFFNIKKEDYASSIALVGQDSIAVLASSTSSSLTGDSITFASPSSSKSKTLLVILTHYPHPIHLSLSTFKFIYINPFYLIISNLKKKSIISFISNKNMLLYI